MTTLTEKLRGTGVALVTPFYEDLSVDFDALERLTNHVTEGGVEYLVVNGTTGESPVTSTDEKAAILKFIHSKNTKKLPVVYGIGGNNTAHVLETIRNTNFEGIDAVLSVCPYYNKPPQEGLFNHFTQIADACPVPIILYNVPGRTSCNLSAIFTLKLAEHPNIIGIKEASGDLIQCMEIAKHKPKDFLLISGDDLLTVPMISIGGEGVISVLANAFPKDFSESVRTALEGNFTESRRLLFKFTEINPLLYEESNPVGIKQVLELLRINSRFVRSPLVNASENLKARISSVMPQP